jgi:hypothetical protein
MEYGSYLAHEEGFKEKLRALTVLPSLVVV